MKSKVKNVSKCAVMVLVILAVVLISVAGVFAETGSFPGQLNINTADSGQLVTLPGIGHSKAEAIVRYRTEHGPFPTVESIVNVRGIGTEILEKIRPFITTDN